MEFQRGQRVHGYILETSEGPATVHCEGIVVGHMGVDVSYELQDSIGDECLDGDLVVDWEGSASEPTGSIRAYHTVSRRGPHVYEQRCYGGYWEVVIIVV